MKLFGILGFPLGHSYSPAYFNEKFRREGIDARYLTFELEDLAALPALIARTPELCGLNVTIPHKQRILPYLDTLSPEARAVGAVNCIRIRRDGGIPHLSGHNTDVIGFRNALTAFLPTLSTSQHPLPSGTALRALVLGNGGAACAVRHVLDTLRIAHLTATRHPRHAGEIPYAEVPRHLPRHLLVINATPLGTHPASAACPDLPYDRLTPAHCLFDLVYNPAVTEFMKRGAARGARTCNGLAMLTGQAEAAWDIWNNG